jgi:hypothetical protein
MTRPGPRVASHRRHPDRRMRALGRAGQHRHVAEAVEAALERHALLGPQPPQGQDSLLEARPALLHGDPEAVELVGHEGPRHPHVEPSPAERVEHRELPGQLQGMVERGQDRAGDHAHARRPLGARGQEHGRVRAVATVGREVVLDHLHAVVAEGVRPLGQGQRLLEVLPGRDPVRAAVGEEADAELHGASAIACRATAVSTRSSYRWPRWMKAPSSRMRSR